MKKYIITENQFKGLVKDILKEQYRVINSLKEYNNNLLLESTSDYWPGRSDDGTSDILSDITDKTSKIQNKELKKKEKEIMKYKSSVQTSEQDKFFQKWMYANMITTSLQDGFFIKPKLIDKSLKLYKELMEKDVDKMFGDDSLGLEKFKKTIPVIIMELEKLIKKGPITSGPAYKEMGDYFYSPGFLEPKMEERKKIDKNNKSSIKEAIIMPKEYSKLQDELKYAKTLNDHKKLFNKYGVNLINYNEFIKISPKEQVPPHQIPLIGAFDDMTKKTYVVVADEYYNDRNIKNAFYYGPDLDILFSHENIHKIQIGRRNKPITPPLYLNVNNRKEYYSLKEEIMALSNTIVKELIKKGLKSLDDLFSYLKSNSLYYDIKSVVEPHILNRYKKYIYLYAEKYLSFKNIHENILFESKRKSNIQRLKDNKVPLTPEERDEVMKSKATWNFGPNGKPSPAVWKSKHKNGKITYVTNSHRAFNTATTLKGAINRFHKFIKGTS